MGELKEEYAEFFSEFDRVSSRRAKKVQVVHGERLGEFIFKLSNDPAIDIEAAALVPKDSAFA